MHELSERMMKLKAILVSEPSKSEEGTRALGARYQDRRRNAMIALLNIKKDLENRLRELDLEESNAAGQER